MFSHAPSEGKSLVIGYRVRGHVTGFGDTKLRRFLVLRASELPLFSARCCVLGIRVFGRVPFVLSDSWLVGGPLGAIELVASAFYRLLDSANLTVYFGEAG